MQSSKRRYFVIGIIIVVLALWLLGLAFGLPVPSFALWWPIFPLLGGIGSAVDYVLSRRSSSLGQAIVGIGIAGMGFCFSFGVFQWGRPGQWWPALFLIAGAALLATWLAGGAKSPPPGVIGVLCLGVGISGLAARFDWLEKLMPSPLVFWSLLLLVIGILVLWRALRKSDQPEP